MASRRMAARRPTPVVPLATRASLPTSLPNQTSNLLTRGTRTNRPHRPKMTDGSPPSSPMRYLTGFRDLLAGVVGQEDGDAQRERGRDEQGAEPRDERADDHGQCAELLGDGVPLTAPQEAARPNAAREARDVMNSWTRKRTMVVTSATAAVRPAAVNARSRASSRRSLRDGCAAIRHGIRRAPAPSSRRPQAAWHRTVPR